MVSSLKENFYPAGAGPAPAKRPQRVADMIRGEIGMLLLTKVKDPRLSRVTVVSVQVTPDLRRAKIFYSVFGDEQQVKKAGDALDRAKGFIRSHLAKKLALRVTPDLEFVYDLTMVHLEEIDRLFKEIGTDQKSTE